MSVEPKVYEEYIQRMVDHSRDYYIEHPKRALAAQKTLEDYINELNVPGLGEQMSCLRATIAHALVNGKRSRKKSAAEVLSALCQIHKETDDYDLIRMVLHALDSSDAQRKQGRPTHQQANIVFFARDVAKMIAKARPERFPSTRGGVSRPELAKTLHRLLKMGGVPDCLMPSGAKTVQDWIKLIKF